ncbi:MAG TPA: ATP synthase F1 subunit delta [Acidobacteriota bacterium]|nr:ATP synthase F1 subunit delta [Acidobacteriota bacterium]
MSKDILISTPARRYAHALMQVAIKHRNFTTVLEELELFLRQLQDVPVLRTLFVNPAVPSDKKTKILEDVGNRLKFQPITLNFLKTLTRRNRLTLLEEVIPSAEQQFLEMQGIVVVEVTTARRMDPDEQRGLAAKLEDLTGKKVQLENRVDPGLIGGVVTRIGTTLYDGSIQAQLEQMKLRMVQS